MLLLFLLIGISVLPLYSQALNSDENDGSDGDLADKKKQIENLRIQKINNLLTQNKISEIDTLFNSDEKDYFTLLKLKELENASFVREMMFKAYRNVSSLQDNLLFLECKKAAFTQDWDLASLKANDLVRRFPDSDRKDDAVNYWKFALIKSGKDQEYITLVEQYPEFDKPLQKYHYGQSLYNVGRYDEAQQYLIEVGADPQYGFRATATLGLLSFAKGNTVEATEIFDYLEANYPPETPYYDFVILSKARLFSHFKDTQDALLYYKAYSDMKGDSVTADVIYEIALTYRNAGEVSKAKKSFEALIASKNGDNYYIPALYNLVMIDAEMNDGEASDTLLANYQNRVDDYFEGLVINKNLMNEVRSLRNRYIMENEKSSKDILLGQIQEKEIQILTNQKNLSEQSSYLSPKTVKLINDIETQLITTTETYFLELDEIEKYRESPKDRLIEIANKNRETNESSYVLSITGELLDGIPNPNDDQFIRAYEYANQIYIKKKLIINISNLVEKSKNLPEKNRELKAHLNDEIESLDELNVRATYELAEFPNLDSKKENIDKMVADFVVEEQEMEVKRKKVIDSYYDIVANKRKKNVVNDFQELDKSISAYANSFKKFEDLKNEQHKNIEFIALDLEYKKIMKRYTKNYTTSLSDTLNTNKDFEQIISEGKSIYQNMNSFVFKNNNFKDNYKLYFNMAELANFIYPENVRMIYDLYSKVLELNPDFPQKDVIYYNLAVYKQELIDSEIGSERDNLIKAGNYFTTLKKPENVIKNPKRYGEVVSNYIKVIKDIDSEYRVNAMFRMAQLLFSFAVDSENPKYYVEKAVKTYEEIGEIGNQSDRMQALFFSAWNKITIQEYNSAIEDLAILMTMKDDFDVSEKSRYKSAESIIAYALDALPKEEAEEYVINNLYTAFDEETAENSFINLIAKKDLSANYKVIVDLYDARSKVDPTAIYNPTYIDSIITTIGRYHYEMSSDSLQSWGNQIYKDAYERYGYNSEWYQYNKNNDIAPYVASIQKALEEHVIYEKYTQMKDNPTLESISSFTNIVDEYANYKGFDETRRAVRIKDYDKNSINNFTKYVIANPDTTSWRMGIENVYKYIERNPDVEERATMEENAYYWAHNTTTVTDSTIYDTTLVTPAEVDMIKAKARQQYLEVADRFYNFLATSDLPDKDETLHKLLYWRGRRKLDMGDKDGARNDFLACDSLNISDKFKENIYSNLAQIHYDDGEFDTANDYYARAQKYADAEKKKEYTAAIYKTKSDKLDVLKESGALVDAALLLEDLNSYEFTTEEMREQNKVEVIALLAEGKDFQPAIDRLLAEARNKNDVSEAWNYYSQAIPLAQDSLKDVSQAIAIRDTFMKRFPNDMQTFIILKERLEAVSDSTLSTYDPLLASEKYIEIYNRATQAGEKLDISANTLTPVEYYALGVVSKCTVLPKADQVNEWVAFRAKFPDYNTVAVLTRICLLYKELGMDDKYLENIITLYKTDNTTNLYPAYAADKLYNKNKEIYSAYTTENWQVMLDKIDEFEVLSATFTKNGIPETVLTIPELKKTYAKYIQEYEFDKEKKAFLADLDKNINKYLSFIEVDPNDSSRLKVNKATNWYGYLAGGQNRFKNLDDKAQEQYKLIEQDIIRVNEFDLRSNETYEQVYRLSLAEYRISSYISDIYINQINKFMGYEYNADGNTRYGDALWDNVNLTVDQINAKEAKYLEELSTVPYTYINKYVERSRSSLRTLYKYFVNGFTDKPEGSDIIIAGLAKYELDEGKPVKEINLELLPQMRKDFSNITETIYNDGFRDFSMYGIPGGESLLLETNIECPIFPKQYRFRFVSEQGFATDKNIDFQVKINDKIIDINSELLFDGEINDTLSTYPSLLRQLSNINNIITNDLLVGNNTLSISLVNNNLNTVNIGMQFSLSYDQEELYIHENQIISTIVSDNSWVATDSLQTLDLTDPSWKQVNYGAMLDDYYQLDVFKVSTAMPIWLNSPEEENGDLVELAVEDIDTTLVAISELDSLGTPIALVDSTLDIDNIEDVEEEVVIGTMYFAKEFEVEGNVIGFTTYYLLNESARVFLNGEEITELWPFYAPPETDSFQIEDKLLQGKNTIIFAVNGPMKKNGLIVEMRIKTLNERR